jgi:hypothetical protein
MWPDTDNINDQRTTANDQRTTDNDYASFLSESADRRNHRLGDDHIR